MTSLGPSRAALFVIAGVCAATTLTAACTSSGSNGSPSSGASSSLPGQLPSGVTQGPLPSTVANKVDKRKDVVITSCTKTADGWQAQGKVKNPGSDSATYRVTVFFTTSAATTLSFARTKITVKPGGTESWTAAANFKAAPTMLCVLRGVG